MCINWKVAAGVLIIAVAVLGTVLGISFFRASGGGSAAQNEVTVQFNSSVTQDDIDEAGALLRTFDDDLEFVIMEIFPPVGRAIITTAEADFCQTVEAALKAKSYVNDVSCRPWAGGGGADLDTPVSTENELGSQEAH